MNRRSYLNLVIGALSLLLIDLGVAMPAQATGISCRGSALRVDASVLGIINIVYEPIVANGPNFPCVSGSASAASAFLPLPIIPILPPIVGGTITADVLSAQTVAKAAATDLPNTAEAKLADLNILGLVVATLVDAKAQVDHNGADNACVLKGNSSIAGGVVLGIAIPNPLTTPLDIPIPLIGVLHLNKQVVSTVGPFKTLIQRAVWLEVTNVLVLPIAADVVVGEAIVDTKGNPCRF